MAVSELDRFLEQGDIHREKPTKLFKKKKPVVVTPTPKSKKEYKKGEFGYKFKEKVGLVPKEKTLITKKPNKVVTNPPMPAKVKTADEDYFELTQKDKLTPEEKARFEAMKKKKYEKSMQEYNVEKEKKGGGLPEGM